MNERVLPLHFQALRADAALPLAERTAELLERDLRRWTRRYLRPVVRVISAVLVFLIVTVKRLLPFQFSWHTGLDWLSIGFLRHCVSREGGELLLRHFIVETALIRFIARNSGFPAMTEPGLAPTRLRGLLGHAVIRHDIHMYCAMIEAGEGLRAADRTRFERLAEPDFSMLEVPEITPDEECLRLINLDLGTALYLMNIPFALLTTEDVYEQAVTSFALDESLLTHLSDITGDARFLAWCAPQSLARPEIDGDVPRALYWHALVHEYAHTHLCRLATASRRNVTGETS